MAQRWIRLTDCQPTQGQRVLITGWQFDLPGVNRFYMTAVYLFGQFYGEDDDWDDAAGLWEMPERPPFLDPTHWQPIIPPVDD